MEKTRLGIIGCGGMGASHLMGLTEVTDLCDITATCDVVEDRARDAAQALGAPRWFTDYKDMVDCVDAVLLVLPHHLHYEVGMFFVRRKKHVLMEKPMCNTEDECVNLIEAAEENGVTLMTAYPVRYWPETVKLKELADSGKYGDVFHMSIWTEQYTNYSGTDKGWPMRAKTLGGGQLFSHGCHYIDILLWFLGRPVSGSHVGTNYGTPWMEREGTSNVAIRFESGAVGYHFGTWGARGTQHGYCFQLHCTKGMLEYHRKSGQIRFYSNRNSENLSQPEEERVEVLWEDHDLTKKTQHETRHFLECIRDHKTPLTDGPGSLQGLRCIWRMYEAEETGIVADLKGLGLDEDWRKA